MLENKPNPNINNDKNRIATPNMRRPDRLNSTDDLKNNPTKIKKNNREAKKLIKELKRADQMTTMREKFSFNIMFDLFNKVSVSCIVPSEK